MSLFPKHVAADLAKTLAALCFRNAEIEHIHAGSGPVTKTGDFSDVKVIDADGKEWSWNEISRITDHEMKVLNKGLINRLYTFFMQGDDPRFHLHLKHHRRYTHRWDAPEIDPVVDCNRPPGFDPDKDTMMDDPFG